MFDRIRVRWYRFTHGEDVFDGWPGEDVDRATPTARPDAAAQEVQPER